MARYIDVELLLQDISESVVFTVRDAKTSPELRGARKILDRIENAPTADVVEVKHGEWQREIDDFDWEYIKCSVCGEELYPPDNDDTFDILPKYCQDCGAKMDGKEQNVV